MGKMITPTEEELKSLMSAQQGELDAVLLYKSLARRFPMDERQEIFNRIATDEGRHASILRAYTGKTLTPKRTKANIVSAMSYLLGMKKTLQIISKGEKDSVKEYDPLVKRFPNIESIMADELRHGEAMLQMKEKWYK